MFIKIIEDVRAWFATHGVTATVSDGIDAVNAQDNHGLGTANRVVFSASAAPLSFVPIQQIGEDDTGRRQLANVMFVFDVTISGYDASQPTRDLAHRHKCFLLLEAVVQAAQHAYWGAHSWTSARWEDTRKQGRHGAELVATLSLNIPLLDQQWESATPEPIPGEPKPVEP